jgi:type IV pilus secretin PilQ/predicted competence protein
MRVFDSRKSLAFGLFLMAFTLVVQAAGAAAGPKDTAAVKAVKDIAITPSGDLVEARITTTGPARFTYFELSGPRRLVVDFHDLQNAVSFKEKLVSAGGVERVRAGLFQDKDRNVTRIVFDLSTDAQYQIVDDKSELVRVVFGRTSAGVRPATPLQTEPASKVSATVAVAAEKVPANLVAGPVMLPESTKTEKTVPTLPRFNPQTVTLTAQDLNSPQLVPGLMLAAALPAATAGQSQINLGPQTVPGSTLTTPAQPAQYTGEIVSFDVRDLDLKDFFRLISETSGLNVTTDQNVSGVLPVFRLTDVPWDQALDIVLKQNQLKGELQGNILRIATVATLQSEDNARKAALDAKDAISPLETHQYTLNYTKASVVQTMLTSGQEISKRGNVNKDDRKNALIITDIPTQFARIEQIIKFLDTPAEQVEIEGRLLSANKSFSRDLGSQLGLLFGNRTGNILTGASGSNSPFTVVNGANPRVQSGAGVPLLSNLPAAATSGIAFLIQPGGDVLLDAIVTAAEASGRAKLLSSPRITTQNNQPATVSQGTQIPVQTNVNNTVTTSFIDFSLNLTVTPQITAAGTILLTVALENSVPDFARSVDGIPSVASQKARTQVLIPDGGTAVIGGIYVDTDSLNVRQVPGFGSIPILGYLFKQTSTIKSTSELIFFVTPKVKSIDQIIAAVPDVRAEPQR